MMMTSESLIATYAVEILAFFPLFCVNVSPENIGKRKENHQFSIPWAICGSPENLGKHEENHLFASAALSQSA